MTNSSYGLNLVVFLSVVLGVLHIALGGYTLATGVEGVNALISFVYILFGIILVPLAFTIKSRMPLGQYLGIALFGGLAIVHFAALTREISGGGLLLIGVLSSSALYLLFASEEFKHTSGERGAARIHHPGE